jgi:DNA-directed RNA polymerase subunit beta (EC 2.7.7.6)
MFWGNDLKELFTEISPIRDYTGKELELWIEDFKLDETKYKNDLEARMNNDSYEASIRVKVRLVNLKTKESKTQEIFLCDFPLMTERGTFIVNGVERVCISQLIRSAGVFFSAQNIGGKNFFGTKIIPNRGSWLELETAHTGFIGVKIDRKRRVPATTLLRAFGIDNDNAIKELFADVNKGEVDFIEETIKKDPTHNQAEALVEIYQRLRPGDLATADTAKELIWNMFFNFERYDLSKVGRWKMWKRLPQLKAKDKTGDKVEMKDRVLTVDDIVAVIKEIIRLNNDPLAKPDEIDHLGNRRVRTLNELLVNRLRLGFMRMERIIKDRMSTLEVVDLSPMQLINPRPVMAVIKEFFSSSQLSQFMDNENPLSELEHKRRLAATGPGGLTRERAGFEVRDVQPSHYGRICPIQTPEGPNVGLVGYLASYTKINNFGFLETPYYKVTKGRVTDELVYMTADEEEKYNIATAIAPLDEKNNIIPKKLEARMKGEPEICAKEDIDYIDVSPQQILSVGTSLIPFLQNDDANRALMGSNMQRQSTPLVKPDPPLVMTGSEERIAHDSGHILLAEGAGVVTEVDGSHITVKYDDKELGEKTYYLRTFLRTNQYTCFHQSAIAKKAKK